MRSLPLGVGLLAVLLLLMLTGELGVLTGDRLLGAGTADTWGHVWGYGWVGDAVAHGRVPFHDAPINHPAPQSWWIIDFPTALLVAPVARVAPALGFNLAVALHVGLGAAGTLIWLLRRGTDRWVAGAAALVIATSPFVRGAITSAVPEALVVLLIPWLLLALEPGLRGANRSLAVATALAFVLGLDGMYGGLLVALAGAFAVAEAARSTRSPWPIARVVPVAVATLGAALLTRWAVANSEHPALHRALERGLKEDLGGWVHKVDGGADLASIWVPSLLLPLVHSATEHRHVVYVGVLLGTLAVVAAARRPALRPLAALGFCAGVLALGPELRVWGVLRGVPLPGSVVWELGASNLYRFAGLVPLALVACVGLAWPPRIALPLLALVALDGLIASPIPLRIPSIPNPAGAVEAWLADAPDGAVLDLPFDREGQRNRGAYPQRAFGLQASHHKALASGLYRKTQAPHQTLTVLDRSLHRGWEYGAARAEERSDRAPGLPPVPAEAQVELMNAVLWRDGFRYVVMDLEAVSPELRVDTEAWMRAWLGEPDQADGLRLVWALPDASSFAITPRRSHGAAPAGSREP